MPEKPVVAYINPITNLLVREDDVRNIWRNSWPYCVHTASPFQMLAFTFAAHAIQDYIRDITHSVQMNLQHLPSNPLIRSLWNSIALRRWRQPSQNIQKNWPTIVPCPLKPIILWPFADDQDPDY